MSKKVLAIVLVVMMAASVFTGCLSSKQAPAPDTSKPAETTKPAEPAKSGDKKVIKISIGLNEQHPEYAGLVKFKEYVDSKTDKYDIQLYANAQLGDDIKAMEGLKMGTLEMTVPSTSPIVGIEKAFGVFDLPFLFPNEKVADAVLDGPVGQKIMDLLTPKGLKALAYWENGYRQLTNSKREVKAPADLAGLKIRTMQNDIHLEAWKALGASPTPMPFSEVFTAMQQKTIDGQENPIPTIYQQKFFEVQKYVTLSNHVYTPFIMLISTKVWDAMPKEDQAIFQEAAYAARDTERQVNRQQNKDQAEELKKNGMTVTELTSEQMKAFQDKVKPVYDQFADKIGKDILDEVLAEVEKASK